jgi:hypothetical protein
VTEPPVTLKVAEVALPATPTEPGVLKDELLSDSVTVAPPPGAAAESVTVHVEFPPEAIVDGAQLKPETVGAAV